jgi:D-glycero-alpha-D-manno-heptose-7-phosphate kinase
MTHDSAIIRRINAVAPTRICDVGGWTDTWFARYGSIFNIAVYPYAEVQVTVAERKDDRRVTINLENYNDSYTLVPELVKYDKNPLIEAAIDIMDIPEQYHFNINIHSNVPPGAATGTSAAISVALVGALDALTPGRMTAYEVAKTAHCIETEKLNLQSGIQDQLCCAYGGINYIQMTEYPNASVSPVMVPNSIWWELENRLALVFIGEPHSSSEIHEKVIESLGKNPSEHPALVRLRRLAEDAKNAVFQGDFGKLATAMSENTEVQREMNSGLVCDKFQEIIDISRHNGAKGFKVNGAGGDGGTVTVLTDGDMAKKRALLEELRKKGFTTIDVYLARHGLRVW